MRDRPRMRALLALARLLVAALCARAACNSRGTTALGSASPRSLSTVMPPLLSLSPPPPPRAPSPPLELPATAPPRAADQSLGSTVQAYQAAALQVGRAYKHDPRHVCASAAVHGLLNKTCSPDCLPTAATYENAHEQGVPIYSGAMDMPVHVSERYRFIYVRQPKSASSSILYNIESMLCEVKPCDPGVWRTVPVRQVTEATWAAYFVFTMVRNPWMRMASAYTFLTGRFLYKRRPGGSQSAPGSPCRISFARFARDSHRLMDLCETNDCCAYITRIGTWMPEFVEGHTSDQAHLVFAADGRSLVDFVGRTEHASEDWADIVRIINEREGTRFPTAEVQSKNRQRANDAEAKANTPCNETRYAAMYDESSLRSVAMQYAMDVVRFGYLDAAAAA